MNFYLSYSGLVQNYKIIFCIEYYNSGPIASDLGEDFIYTVLYIINMHVCIKTNGFKIQI